MKSLREINIRHKPSFAGTTHRSFPTDDCDFCVGNNLCVVPMIDLTKNKTASPQLLHKIIMYFELIQSGKKKHNVLYAHVRFRY